MRELWLFVVGAIVVLGSILTLVWMRTFEPRTNQLGWADKSGPFGKRRWLQFIACVATAIGVFVAVTYGIGMPPGPGRTSELGLVFILISIVWVIFRRDIAAYQYQIAMTMFNKLRPEQEQEQLQLKAVETLGIVFSVLLFVAGILLLTLNLTFS